MKIASGIYINMFDEVGYLQYLPYKLDIFFIFPESMSAAECQVQFNDMETRTRKILENAKQHYGDGVCDKDMRRIKCVIEDEFKEDEVQVIVMY